MKDSSLALRSGLSSFFISLVIAGVCRGQSYIRIESEAESQARARIDDALSAIGSIDCVDKPLSELAEELGRRTGVSIVLATSTLSDAAITTDTPVTAKVSGISYRSLLYLVLKDLKLTWIFRDEVILITTPEDAESQLETRLYPVLDLVATAGNTAQQAMRSEHDYDTLLDMITTTVEPDSWDEVGGPGTIAEYPLAGALVISQTGEIHEHVEKVLAAIRRVKEIQGIPAVSLVSAQSKRIKTARSAAAEPRHYSTAAAQAWQLPRVHGGE